MNYNYLKEETNDVINYILKEMYNAKLAELEDMDELREYLHDELWANDAITGNGSGSYTFNTWQAEEYIAHNWDLLNEAVNELSALYPRSAEDADVLIRCYLLHEAISTALEDKKVIARYREAREKAAIAALKEDGWEGNDISLAESLLEYGFAVKRDGDLVETLHYIGEEEDGARLYYDCKLTRNQYAELFGIIIPDGADAATIASLIGEAASEDLSLQESLSGAADAWAAYHSTTLAEFAL